MPDHDEIVSIAWEHFGERLRADADAPYPGKVFAEDGGIGEFLHVGSFMDRLSPSERRRFKRGMARLRLRFERRQWWKRMLDKVWK